MARGTAADNSVTPVVLNRLFETAARIEESSLLMEEIDHLFLHSEGSL